MITFAGMGFWARVASFFEGPPKPEHPAVSALRARRDAYVTVVRDTALTRAVYEAARARAAELDAAARLWAKRAESELPDDLREAVETLARRLADSAGAALAVARAAAESLEAAAGTIETMSAADTALIRQARDLGLTVSDLTVEFDVRELQREADDRLRTLLVSGGALEPDEDRDFLDRLFDGTRLRQPARPRSEAH